MKIRTPMITRSVLMVLIAASVSLAGIAQKPNFSGTWELNESKSKLGAEFSFAPTQVTITQEGNTLTSETVNNFQGQEFRQNNTYSLDGTESKNEGFQGSVNVSVAEWQEDGMSLLIATTIEMMDGGELVIKATYSMDGANLTIQNAMEGGPMGGGSPELWVFDKQ